MRHTYYAHTNVIVIFYCNLHVLHNIDKFVDMCGLAFATLCMQDKLIKHIPRIF
jgi:hypothetical protein